MRGEQKTSETIERVAESEKLVDSGREQKARELSVVLSSDDRMTFDKNTIEVYEEQAVQLTLKNTGKMSKQSVGHNSYCLQRT